MFRVLCVEPIKLVLEIDELGFTLWVDDGNNKKWIIDASTITQSLTFNVRVDDKEKTYDLSYLLR